MVYKDRQKTASDSVYPMTEPEIRQLVADIFKENMASIDVREIEDEVAEAIVRFLELDCLPREQQYADHGPTNGCHRKS